MANLTSRSVRILQADDYIYAINNAGTQEGRSLVSDLTALIGGSSSNKEEITQSAHGFVKYDALAFNGTSYVKAQADTADNSSVVGIVDELIDGNTFSITYGGLIPWDVENTPDRAAGNDLWLSQNTAGLVVDTEPSLAVGEVRQYVGEALVSGLLVNIDLGQEIGAEDTTKVVQLIDADMTLYLDPSGSDTTGDGSAANPWATPHKAYDYLQDFKINESAVVTIYAAAGTYNFTEQLRVEHAQGNRIRIEGASLTGAIPVNADFVTDAATNETFIRGRYATVFEWDLATTSCIEVSATTFTIQDIAIINVNASSGFIINTSNSVNGSTVQINGSVSLHGGDVDGVNIKTSGNLYVELCDVFTVTNMGSAGLLFSNGFAGLQKTVVVACRDGITSVNNSFVQASTDCFVRDNTRWGCRCTVHSAFLCTGNLSVSNNATDDFHCDGNSYMRISGSAQQAGNSVMANTRALINTDNTAGVTYSPAIGVVGNDRAYIT